MSSWREVARAAVQREAIDCEALSIDCGNIDNNADASGVALDDRADALAEREAIAIMDGGLPPEWAAALSMLERSPKPEAISFPDWRRRLDALWLRADLHGADFAANGWTFEEVFGVGEHWARLDERGAAWLAPEARIVEITPTRITFERGSQRSTHERAH